MRIKILSVLAVLPALGMVTCDPIGGGSQKGKKGKSAKSGAKTSMSAGKRVRPRPRPPAAKDTPWVAAQKDGPTLPAAVRGAPFGVHASKAKGITIRSAITGVGTMVGHEHRELEIKVAFNVTSDRVGAYRISVDRKTLARLESLWGPARVVHGLPMWFNPKAGLRVRRRKDYKMLTRLKQGVAVSAGISTVVKAHTLIFEPYTPLSTLLGPGKGLTFLPKPILGRTVAQIKADYPERFARDKDLEILQAGELQFPPTEYTVPVSELFTSQTTVTLEEEGGRVVSFSFEIGYKDAAYKAGIYKLLTKKLGTSKLGRAGKQHLGKPPRIFSLDGGRQLAVYKALMGKSLVLRVSRGTSP